MRREWKWIEAGFVLDPATTLEARRYPDGLTTPYRLCAVQAICALPRQQACLPRRVCGEKARSNSDSHCHCRYTPDRYTYTYTYRSSLELTGGSSRSRLEPGRARICCVALRMDCLHDCTLHALHTRHTLCRCTWSVLVWHRGGKADRQIDRRARVRAGGRRERTWRSAMRMTTSSPVRDVQPGFLITTQGSILLCVAGKV